ncbi:MAG: hypothetical protein WA139_01735 [Candidatus Aenigmatarchaeota archaeon]
MIDDDVTICKQIEELLDGEIINGNTIKLEYTHKFDQGLSMLKDKAYDLIILDLYKGIPSITNTDRPGEQILEHIKGSCFIPIIFFSGLVNPIQHLKSDVVRIVRKGDGNGALIEEIKSVFDSKLPLIKRKIDDYLNVSMRSYFWDFVHPNWASLKEIEDDVSLGYLLIRRFANSLSKEQIIKLLDDPKIKPEKSYPMEFYIYPPNKVTEYEMGDILKKDDSLFVLLTPSCDLVNRGEVRKAQYILLVKATLLKDTDEYKAFKENESCENKKNLIRLIESRKSDRNFFFLPKTFFIPNCTLDFQNIVVVPTDNLTQYSKIAKLDDPYAQSMLANFIRYYNRVGHEDIDSNYVMQNLE